MSFQQLFTMNPFPELRFGDRCFWHGLAFSLSNTMLKGRFYIYFELFFGHVLSFDTLFLQLTENLF